MSDGFRLQLRFWGVRGSTPTPTPANLSYGGNTSCLEIRAGDGEFIIIDGGTGIRNLGLSLMEEFQSRPIHLKVFLTHFHWDHIQGLPFFAPLYNPSNSVSFHSFPPERQLCETLEGQMSSPYFPVSFQFLPARRKFVQIQRETLRYGDLAVTSFPMNHPQGAYGYRVESKGAVIVFASDLEHGDPELDKTVREYSEGADVLIYDAQYTPEEYISRKGWGHSTYLEAAGVAKDAQVKQLILFHHDPAHEDAKMDNMVSETKRLFENTQAAREAWSVDL